MKKFIHVSDHHGKRREARPTPPLSRMRIGRNTDSKLTASAAEAHTGSCPRSCQRQLKLGEPANRAETHVIRERKNRRRKKYRQSSDGHCHVPPDDEYEAIVVWQSRIQGDHATKTERVK